MATRSSARKPGATGPAVSRTAKVEALARDAVYRESEAFLRAALQFSELVVFRQDRQLRYVGVANPGLGATASELIGRTDRDLLGPVEARKVEIPKRRVIRTGRGERLELWLTHDGRTGCFDLVIEPVRDGAGRVIGIVCAAADITERKRAQAAAAESAENLRNAVVASNMLMWHQDRAMRYTWVGNSLAQFPPEALLGRTDAELFPGPELEGIVKPRRESLRTGRPTRADVALTLGGRRHVFDLTSVPRLDERGRVVGIVCAAIDVTERRRVQAELEEARTRLRQFGAYLQDALEAERVAIARDIHDQVGAQLTGLRLRLGALAQDLPADAADSRERIDALLDLTGDIVASTRAIGARLRPPMLDDLGLARTCRWYLKDWRETTGLATSSRIGRLVPEPPAEVRIDAFRILQELLTNVARHARATRVRVELAGGERALRLTVSDDGRGMAGAGRGNGAAAEGLGLLGVRERASRHGCSVEMKSGRGGTRVVVRLRWGEAP